MDKATAAFPDDPLPTHRVGMVAIGQGVRSNEYRLFRKLRPHGTYFTKLNPGAGVRCLGRTRYRDAPGSHPEPYGPLVHRWRRSPDHATRHFPGFLRRPRPGPLSLATPHAKDLRGASVGSGSVPNTTRTNEARRDRHARRRWIPHSTASSSASSRGSGTQVFANADLFWLRLCELLFGTLPDPTLAPRRSFACGVARLSGPGRGRQ